MYTETERQDYYDRVLAFLRGSSLFEGAVQIGSGTYGYTDMYSDIDLMAACTPDTDIQKANEALTEFFINTGASYIWERTWTASVSGVTAYFKNGLNIDISFGPTKELELCSPLWKIVLDKTGQLARHCNEDYIIFLEQFSDYGISEMTVFGCLNALRRFGVALKRGDFIYAANMLNEARDYTVKIVVANEGLKVHQFKSFTSLPEGVRAEITATYPKELDYDDIKKAGDRLLSMLKQAVEKHKKLEFTEGLWSVLTEE